MNTYLLALFLAVTMADDSQFRNAEPGRDAAEAFRMSQVDPPRACASLVQQVRGGSSDPWAYLGLAICGSDFPETHGEVLETLNALPQESPLVLFARGHMNYGRRDLEKAETFLRRATQQQEDFALAWNTLAATVLDQGDARSALTFAERALELSPGLMHQTMPVLQQAQSRLAGVDRLLQQLGELPQFWDSFSQPILPISGRSHAEVLTNSSEPERRRALEFISFLFQQPLEQRADWIASRLVEGPVNEVDLWIPFALAESEEARNPDEAVLIYEAALQWAAELGRRDVLIYGAAMAFDCLEGRVKANDLQTALGAWADLPRQRHAEHGWAKIQALHARSLLQDGRYSEALLHYREARKVLRQLNDTIGQAQTLDGEADILARQAKTAEALEAYEEARKLFQTASEPTGHARTWIGEGRVRYLRGELELALHAYRAARTLSESSGDQASLAQAAAGTAEVYLQLGQEDWALTAYQEAADHFQAMNDLLSQGSVRVAEGDVLFQLSRDESALDAYREARQLLRVVGDALGQGNSWDGEGDILLRSGDLPGALHAYRVARGFYEEVNDALGEGSVWKGEANVYYRAGEYGKAVTAAAQAVAIFRRLEIAPNLLNALLRESEARLRNGENTAALMRAGEATDLFATWRQGYVAEEHRTDVDVDITRAYDVLLFLLTREEGRLNEALSRAEESRSRVLLDLLTAGGIGATADSPDLAEEKRRHLADLAEISTAFAKPLSPVATRKLLARREALDAALQRNLYQRVSHSGNERLFGRPLDAHEITNLAEEVGPMVLYHGLQNELLAFLILPSKKIILRRLELPREELRASIEDFLFDLSNRLLQRRSKHRAEQLWQALIAPFADLLPDDGPLTVLPHGPLHDLPFEILLNPVSGKRLFESWDVAVSPSASALALARRLHQTRDLEDSLVAFAAGVGLQLPEKDMLAVAKFFPEGKRKAFGPPVADFQAYEEHASKARHLLLASEGVQASDSRRGTFLEIQPTPGVHDERLTAAEIATIPLDAELVTLAACDTDRGDALPSDERLTLTRSFLIAGAASVLATRWRIPEDRSTTRFLVDFYQAYRKGGPEGKGMRKDEALSWARHKSIERGDPAQVWAAWVLVGDAR